MVAYVAGEGVDRIVGFEGLGAGGDGFATGLLERRLVACDALAAEVLPAAAGGFGGEGREKEGDGEGMGKGRWVGKKKGKGMGRNVVMDEDGDDWDD